MDPEKWPAVWKKQEGYGYGYRRPLHYIQALRQQHRKLQLNFHDWVQVENWQKPQERKDHSHAQTQNQPSLYHQTQSQYPPWSDVVTTWPSPSQHPTRRNYLLSKPRSFEFNLKIPFSDFSGQNKETSSTSKGSDFNSGGSEGADHYFQLYRPSSVQIYSAFSGTSGSDKGSANYPNGGKTAHEVSKPSFQLGLSVPIPPPTPSPKPSDSNAYPANLQIPESVALVQNGYMELANPQSSSTQSGSEWIFSNSPTVQQQSEHQTYEPLQTRYTDSIPTAFSPGQHTTPTEQISQGKIPTEQSLAFPEPPAPSLPIPQYPPVQSYSVHSNYDNGQMNPLSNYYGKIQSGQTASSDPPNLSLSPSQYESVPSGHYSGGQVNIGNSYDQHQYGQPVPPVTSASEIYNYEQFNPSFHQNVETAPPLSPVHSTDAPSQYEHPSFQQVATPHYGTGNVVQMGPTDLSSYYQYSRDYSGQAALPDHLTAFDPSPDFQGLSTDSQAQIRYPAQYTGRGQLGQKPEYTKLFVDV